MKPGKLFARGKGRKQWKPVADADGVVHDGKPLHRTKHGHSAEPTDIFSARCDKTLHLYLRTEDPITCLICLEGRI
jgi:hypothetical protein